MSSTKRQSSWQEDIARNFSRLFLRSKSQEPQKTGSDEDDISSDVKDENLPSSEPHEEDPQQKVVLDLSQAAFHPSEGEGRAGAEVGEEEEKEEEAAGSAGLDDAGGGGSPSRLAPASPPRSPAASGPSTPTSTTTPFDAFFRKLGSLFHLSSRTEAGGAVEEGPATDPPDAPGTEGSGGDSAAEPSGTPAAESDADADRLLREGWETNRGRGSREEGASEERRSTPALCSDHPDSPLAGRPAPAAEDRGPTPPPGLNEEAGEDCDVGDPGGVVDTDLEEPADDQRRRLALSCPPIVTYGTYRGSREIRKMRRRNWVQVDSPISEGEEQQQIASSSTTRLSPRSEHAEGVAVLEGEQPGTLAGDPAAVISASLGAGSVPVMIPSEGSVSQSALLPEREPGLAQAPAQTTDSCLGEVSGALSLSASEKDTSDKQAAPVTAGGERECSEEETSEETAEAVAGETKLATERAETLSAQEGSIGSPSKASNSAALSQTHGSQCSPHYISLSATRGDEDSEVPVPADPGTDAQESSSTDSENWFLAPETGLMEDGEMDEEALWFESRQMVDSILRSALAMLHDIESCAQQGEEDKETISPILLDEQINGLLKPEQQQEGLLSDRADVGYLPVSVEQNIDPDVGALDNSRSTLPLGSESIFGLDTDIRKNPLINSDLGSVGVSISASDQRHGEEHSAGGLQALHPPDLQRYSGDQNGCHSGEAHPQSKYNGKPVSLIMGEGDKHTNDHNSNICLNENSKSVTLCKGNLEANEIDVVQTSDNVSEMQEPVCRNPNKGHLRTAKASVDGSFIEAISTGAGGEAINKAFNFTKDRTESNSNGHNLTSSDKEILPTVCGDLNMPNVGCETSIQLNGVQNESCLSMQLARNAEESITCQREAQSEDSFQPSELVTQKCKNLNELHIPSTALEPSESSEDTPIGNPPTKTETLMDLTSKNKVLQDHARADSSSSDEIYRTDQIGMKDLQELCDKEKSVEDHSFALVESYLATVIDDESEPGDEEDASLCARLGSGGSDSKPEASEDPERRESPLSVTVRADDEDSQQWTAVKAYRCQVVSDDSHGSDAHRELAGASTRDHGGKTSASFATARRMHPETPVNASWVELSGPHKFHELDFHDCEGGFAIINEEDEGDTVFVNDTGPMLSPPVRRGKIYPFSLSPIFEEESGREDACSGDLQDALVTGEDLRSVEQQASSILSLLQSVSERLQSSAFTDPYPDSSDELSPTLHRPSWGYLSDQADEDACLTNENLNALSCTQPDKREGSPERQCFVDETRFSGQVDLPSGEMQVADPAPPLGEYLTPAPKYDSTAVSKSPFYEYLKNARCPSAQPSVDNDRPSSSGNPCQGTSAPVLMRIVDKSSEKVIPRPTQMHIYSGMTFSGEKWEINTDMEDTSGMAFPHGVSIRALRGCWLLYQDPGFRGPCVVLEEGDKVLSQDGGSSWLGGSPVTIGSIKRAVKDDSPPEILVRTQEAEESLSAAVDDLGTDGSVCLSSLSVRAGCWVAYECAGFSGNYTVLEPGGSATPGPTGQPVTAVGSLCPLRMGGLKVRRPLDPKLVAFEQPCFGGRSREILGNTPSLGAKLGPQGAASLRVVGGVWVGYSEEGYRGRQYLLEEGEYLECLELGGTDRYLLSFRFLQADFIEPSISLERDLDAQQATVTDIMDLDILDLEKAGFAGKTDFICVHSGVWVAYSERSFRGKQYVLEKGTYTGDLDWGGTTGTLASIRAVRMEPFGWDEPKCLLRAYSQPQYQGDSQEYDGEAPDCTSIRPMSFRVIWGNWLLFDEEGCAGNQFVLGEGLYPDLISCGCVATSVKSLKPIPYSFSDPEISLYSLDSCEGLETIASTPRDSIDDVFTQSLRVHSGLWVVYEHSHFKGRQKLLQPGEFPAWGEHSGWDTVGSLYPLKQPKLYIRIRSRVLGSVLTAEILPDDAPPASVSLQPASGLDSQCWVFSGGLLKCKASKACLSLIGGKAVSGACVALWPEHGRSHQNWSLNQDGTISSHLSHQLVLDVKGGTGFDKDHLVANEFTSDRDTQYWDIEIV